VSDLETITEILREVFGHAGLRDHQHEAIEAALADRDTVVVLPTGAGKSLCYQLPAVVRHQRGEGVTLVVSPLVALMQDQVDALRRRGIAAAFVNATVSRADREARYEAARRGELAMLYVVPERFRRPPFAALLRNLKVAAVAIDEAHCISRWGHDFRPDYRRLGEYRLRCRREDGSAAPVIALTATATPAVEDDIRGQLGLIDPARVRAPIYRDNLRLCAIDTHGIIDKADHIARLVKRIGGAAIVYTGLIARGEKLREELRDRGVHLRFYNGDLPPGPRRRLSRAFIAEKEPALLATNAFGMGIDRPDVRLVIHCELPGAIEAWAQELGRAGRDGDPALIVALLDDDDLAIQQQHVRNSHPDPSLVQSVWDAIDELRGDTAGWTENRLRDRFGGRDRRDHRPTTALRQLDAAGCFTGSLAKGTLRTIAPPPPELLDQAAIDARRQRSLQRLAAMWTLWRKRGCLWAGIAGWFDEQLPGTGVCDACTGEHDIDTLVADLPQRTGGLEPPPPPPSRADDVPFSAGDWLVVGKRMGQLVRIGGQPGKRILRVMMADSLREERVLMRDDGPPIRKVDPRTGR